MSPSITHKFPAIASGVFVCVLTLFFGADKSLAQTTVTPTQSVPTQNSVVLATVNIKDAKIISQDGGTFHISFNLTNREGTQTGVKYGVQLVSKTSAHQVIADEKVYPETLVLTENSSVYKEITYTAPKNLNGDYALFLVSKNESAFPFALSFVGKVTLASTVKGIEIDLSSCFLKVVGEKKGLRYTLYQGVDIAQNENLALSCTATNTAATAVSAVPVFETRYRSAYGAVVSQTGGDTAAISFAANQKKNFSLVLPKAGEPQSYDVSLVLNSGSLSSNSVTAHYVISGSSATIQLLSLDKNFYQKGDTAIFTFMWSPSADAFPGARIGTSSPSAVFASITMIDGNGTTCITPVKEALSKNQNLNVPLLLEHDCTNPHVSLSLVSVQGKVLAQKELALKSPAISQPVAPQTMPLPIAPILIVLGILAVLAGIYMTQRKKEVIPQEMP